MKNLVANALSLSLIAGAALALPTPAIAQGAASAAPLAEFCKANYENLPSGYDTVGDCIGRLRTGFVKFCVDLDRSGFFPIVTPEGALIRNQGNCVAYFRSLGL